MLHTVTARTLAIAACGWLLAWDAAALSLGRAHGAPLIGRPLDISVPVTLDTPDADAPCASADVFYGESRVGRTPSVRWEPGTGGQGVLHVTAGDPVDEPMVTVYLRVGCGQSTTRRFVLLSEPPPANEPSVPLPRAFPVQPPVAAAPTAPRASARAAASAAATPQGSPEAGGRAGSETGRGVNPVPRRRESVAQSSNALQVSPQPGTSTPAGKPVPPAPAQRAKKPDTGSGASRLKLEPLDLSVDRDPTLRLSDELRSQVATDPQQRAAAAALWSALQKTPDEALQDALRLKGVERDLASLRESTRQNATAVGQMRAQVEQARGGRDTAGLLVVVLSAILAALLAWLAWRWYRVHQLERVGRWFEQHGESRHEPLDLSAPDVRVDVAPTEPPVAQPFSAGPGVVAAAAGGALAAAAAAPANAAARVAVVPAGASVRGEEFQTSRGGTVRMVGVEELIDVHDKADFFLSIGETEQAIAVLEAHVHDQVETSALAWMDLLELYHSLGKQVDFERLRNEFLQRFTVQVPDFEHFDQPTASLENYSRALSRIVALWPSNRVLDVIEESIFRKPGLPGAEPFSLEAYRELVLLYHVAREIAPQDQTVAQAGRPSFSDTALQPLNSLDAPDSSLDTRVSQNDMLLVPPASSRIGVDIDLGELAPAAPPDLSLEDEVDFDLPPLESGAADLSLKAEAPAAPSAQPAQPVHAAAPPQLAPEVRAADGSRELPPLDFDVSSFDGLPAPRRKHGS